MLCWSKHSSAPRPDARSACARAREPVVVQAAEIDALLEVHLHVARRLQRPVPAVVRVDVVGADDDRFALFPAGHGSMLRAQTFARLRTIVEGGVQRWRFGYTLSTFTSDARPPRSNRLQKKPLTREPSGTAPNAAAVTIRDVAQAAGVHVSTVSRALDPARRALISAEVLQAVEATALRLGYRPEPRRLGAAHRPHAHHRRAGAGHHQRGVPADPAGHRGQRRGARLLRAGGQRGRAARWRGRWSSACWRSRSTAWCWPSPRATIR